MDLRLHQKVNEKDCSHKPADNPCEVFHKTEARLNRLHSVLGTELGYHVVRELRRVRKEKEHILRNPKLNKAGVQSGMPDLAPFTCPGDNCRRRHDESRYLLDNHGADKPQDESCGNKHRKRHCHKRKGGISEAFEEPSEIRLEEHREQHPEDNWNQRRRSQIDDLQQCPAYS